MLEFRREYYKDLLDFAQRVGRLCGVRSPVKMQALVSNIIDETATTAVKMHLGYIARDALTPRMVYQSAFSLLFHLLGIDVWQAEGLEDRPLRGLEIDEKTLQKGT